MKHTSLEQQLRNDARAIEAECPDRARRRALWRIEQAREARAGFPGRWPWLAPAAVLLVAVTVTWVLVPGTGQEHPAPSVARGPDLHLHPLMTDPDRLFARREAALEEEQQLLTRDLQALRDHITASFESKSNG